LLIGKNPKHTSRGCQGRKLQNSNFKIHKNFKIQGGKVIIEIGNWKGLWSLEFACQSPTLAGGRPPAL
jgi:hypothetical protein